MTEVRCFIGLGSNLDDPVQQIETAFAQLSTLPQTTLVLRSANYESAPLGPQDQPRFINAVGALDTQLSPFALLENLQQLENSMGRDRGAARWGPRCIDLDLLLYGQLAMNEENLVIPHPGLHTRAFVLYPLREIAPQLEIVGLGSIDRLCAHCPEGDIMRLEMPS